MTNTNQVCKRCNGTGFFSALVHVEGGECFACLGTGRKVSAFDKYFAKAKGSFFGVSFVRNGKTVKQVTKASEADMAKCSAGTKVTAITEDQARTFFAKYGSEVVR